MTYRVMKLASSMRASYHQNGFLILEDFITPTTLERLRNHAYELAKGLQKGELPTIHPQGKSSWSLEELEATTRSYCCYWEEDRLKDATPFARLLKISHALHQLDPTFKELSLSPAVTQLMGCLGVAQPHIVQSMLHFKPAYSSSAVEWHQDATYINTTPCSTIGLWLALEDATRENGCLRVIPRAHHDGLCSQLIRSPSGKLSFKTLQDNTWPLHQAIDLPVRAGTLIVLHGLVPHCSGDNSSGISRLSLTLHSIDLASKYSDQNWLPFRFSERP